MHTLRTLVIGLAVTALAVSALAAPVSAAPKTKLAIVNGIPGKAVDVCVNGREVKSGLRYGRFIFRTTRTARGDADCDAGSAGSVNAVRPGESPLVETRRRCRCKRTRPAWGP